MTNFVNKNRFNSVIMNGLISCIIIFITANVFWIGFSWIFSSIYEIILGSTLDTFSASTQASLILNGVEGAFFWLIIIPWIWMALNFGNIGKYDKGFKQPWVGIRYVLRCMCWGLVGFLIITLFLGLWWKPFNLGILLRPATEAEALLAIKGWGAINFFALASILGQIPPVSLFAKWPFSTLSKDAKVVGLGNFFLTLTIALLIWIAFIIPSFLDPIEFAGQAITHQAAGTWGAGLAWAQVFVFFILIPAEGGEGYPQALFTKKQPWSGIVGLLISLIAAFAVTPLLRSLLAGYSDFVGLDPNIMTASFALSIINVLLTWHHLFNDYPTKDMLTGGKRILAQLAIVLFIGVILGFLWPLIYPYLPIGGNDLGLGIPVLGVIAGHFVYMLPMVFMNTGFDKWPVNQNEQN